MNAGVLKLISATLVNVCSLEAIEVWSCEGMHQLLVADPPASRNSTSQSGGHMQAQLIGHHTMLQ